MSEIRQDIFSGEWVIYATNRKQRPYDFTKNVLVVKEHVDCAFCKGNEDKTPPPTFQNGKNGDWTIRAFLNKYPMVDEEHVSEDKDSFYNHTRGRGIHEVLVDTPDHNQKIHEFEINHIIEVLKALQIRYNSIKASEGIRYIQLFKNTGPEAGASIMHSHWQMSGVPFVPFLQNNIYETLQRFQGRNMYREMIKHEKQDDKRIIYENEYFIALVPYASKYSYEMCVYSKECIPTYDGFDSKRLESLGDMFDKVLKKASLVREDICYNICFMDSPSVELNNNFCWYARVIPRIGSLAGFELGTAGYINPVLPEEAAEYIKNLKPR